MTTLIQNKEVRVPPFLPFLGGLQAPFWAGVKNPTIRAQRPFGDFNSKQFPIGPASHLTERRTTRPQFARRVSKNFDFGYSFALSSAETFFLDGELYMRELVTILVTAIAFCSSYVQADAAQDALYGKMPSADQEEILSKITCTQMEQGKLLGIPGRKHIAPLLRSGFYFESSNGQLSGIRIFADPDDRSLGASGYGCGVFDQLDQKEGRLTPNADVVFKWSWSGSTTSTCGPGQVDVTVVCTTK
jgi:hypothetical protein